MKELSYVHAEGYAAGEMKHGPHRPHRPRLPHGRARAGQHALRSKIVSNIEQIRARDGEVLAIVTEGRRRADRPRQRGAHGAFRARPTRTARRHRAPPSSRLRHRRRARLQHRPAPQPRQDGHRGVAPGRASLTFKGNPGVFRLVWVPAAGYRSGHRPEPRFRFTSGRGVPMTSTNRQPRSGHGALSQARLPVWRRAR